LVEEDHMPDTTQIVTDPPAFCPFCGQYSTPNVAHCAHCGQLIEPSGIEVTRQLFRAPLTHPAERPGQDYFAPDANAVLQFLPSGHVLSLKLDKPTILGRERESREAFDHIDLTDLNAVRHGVSRQHCQFRREGLQLVVTDLHSTNGTYLNDRRLEAGKDAIILHGDKLILGTLHLLVTFSALDR
jgi:pSer/pThr/pTyr-binding forkhead associated (FHA) protein